MTLEHLRPLREVGKNILFGGFFWFISFFPFFFFAGGGAVESRAIGNKIGQKVTWLRSFHLFSIEE